MSVSHSAQLLSRLAALLTWLAVLVAPSTGSADPIPFQFGFGASLAVVPNAEVPLPAAIINSGSDPIEFGCARVACDGLAFGGGVGFLFPHPPVNFNFGPRGNDGSSFYDQFVDLTLGPGERFDFVFGRLNALDNPLGTAIPLEFDFLIEGSPTTRASTRRTALVSTEPAIGPLRFVNSTHQPAPVPEPSSLFLIGSGLAYLLSRCRAQT